MVIMSDTWFMVDYRSYANRVVEWNLIARDGYVDNSTLAKTLQAQLIAEELDELWEAYTNRDKINFLKELCDLFVVSSYMIYLMDEDYYSEEDTFKVNRKWNSSSTYANLRWLSDLVSLEDWVSVMKVTLSILTNIDANTLAALELVNDNNFSKFQIYNQSLRYLYSDMAEDIEHLSKGRYNNVQWSVTQGFVIFRDEKGKILKPTYYSPVDLSGCIKRGS